MRTRATTRHLVIGAGLAMLVTLLLIQGFTTKTVGSEARASGGGSTPLAHMPPVLTYPNETLVPVQPRSHSGWWP